MPYFPSLKIACGHFQTSSSEATVYRRLGSSYGPIDPARHLHDLWAMEPRRAALNVTRMALAS